MELGKKYALLDTDFLYKTHLARNAQNHTLAEVVLGFEDYSFFCHEMVKCELKRHDIIPDPNPWLEEKIEMGDITLYSDEDILNKLKEVYGDLATIVYTTLLRESCNTFDKDFFEKYYSCLVDIEDISDIENFLIQLKKCDDNVPHGMGVGEKKIYVLIQMMEIVYGRQVYVFCSDDFKARQSIVGLSNPVNCISVLGVFYKMMKMGHDKSKMQEYYNSLSRFLKTQKEYKVWSSTGHQRIGVPKEKLFDDIYDGKLQLIRTGDLQYIGNLS